MKIQTPSDEEKQNYRNNFDSTIFTSVENSERIKKRLEIFSDSPLGWLLKNPWSDNQNSKQKYAEPWLAKNFQFD